MCDTCKNGLVLEPVGDRYNLLTPAGRCLTLVPVRMLRTADAWQVHPDDLWAVEGAK